MLDRNGERLTLLVVHAHPDDEALGAGATLAKYSAEGVRTVLVTATLGEEGEILDPNLDEAAARPLLGELRRRELAAATAILGVQVQEFLGYRDSGMIDTPANAHPDNFHNADPDEACRRLVALIRKHRPHVVVTYNEDGGYGHPDHLQCHRVTVCAFDAAGDPNRFAGTGTPWQPLKLYALAWSRERWRDLRRRLAARGIPFYFGSPPADGTSAAGDAAPPSPAVDHLGETAAEAASVQDDEEGWGQPEATVTTFIDTKEYWRRTRDALAAHRTQFAPDSGFLTLPDDLAADFRSTEYLVLLRSLVETTLPETDLFVGIRV